MTGTGDLGRRIAHHRERLGLSREQVAERAGVTPGYVEYLEESAGHPTSETIAQLADALDTTRDDLLGGGRERPPGGAPAAAHPVMEKLDEQECLRLIEPGGIGRVAFNGSHGPTILPVNYKLHQGAIVFRTARGGEMDRDLRTGVQGVEIVVGFQVDRIDEVRRAGWSVLVQGPFHHVPEAELEQVIGAEVTPWAGGDRPLYIRILPHRVTGRRIQGL